MKNAITHIRQLLGLTQSEFATLVRVHQSTVSRWEKGARPDFDQIRAIQAATRQKGLECPDEWFQKKQQAA